ncbi:MAG: HAD family hydrolase [Motilibacteraceae bacterium]
MADHTELDPEVPQVLEAACAAGWTPVIVTNGTVEQQERKLSLTGLDQLVAGWVISEAVGAKKPDERIFQLAAAASGASLSGAWMIGDSPHADIAGAHRLGLRSVWLHRGRPWQEEAFAPTKVADDCAQALSHVLAAV